MYGYVLWQKCWKSYTYNILENSQIKPLARTDQIKDLGILLDERLSFRDHINDKTNKAFSMLGIIKCNFKHLTIQSSYGRFKNFKIRSIAGHSHEAGTQKTPQIASLTAYQITDLALPRGAFHVTPRPGRTCARTRLLPCQVQIGHFLGFPPSQVERAMCLPCIATRVGGWRDPGDWGKDTYGYLEQYITLALRSPRREASVAC